MRLSPGVPSLQEVALWPDARCVVLKPGLPLASRSWSPRGERCEPGEQRQGPAMCAPRTRLVSPGVIKITRAQPLP